MRSDGLSETSDGLFAVNMRAFSGEVDGQLFLNFRPSFTGDGITVMWPKGNQFALFPKDVAQALLNRNYATPITAEQVEAYNTVAADKANGAPPAAIVLEPAPKAPAKSKAAQEAPSASSAPVAPPPAPTGEPVLDLTKAPWENKEPE